VFGEQRLEGQDFAMERPTAEDAADFLADRILRDPCRAGRLRQDERRRSAASGAQKGGQPFRRYQGNRLER
jgi:hypothetical protein